MPLYEGIGLIGEKQPHPVILDIGSAYTKCGFSGETGPRAIVPSCVTVDGRQRPLLDYASPEQLYRQLVELLQTVYFRQLLVNAKDRPVVVVESLLTPTVFRNVLANVLFRHYEVSSCLLAPSHLVALLPLGLQTGLVLDIGHRESVCIPVYEGVPMLRAWQALPLGSQAIHSALRASLAEHGSVTAPEQTSVQDVLDSLGDDVIEDITVRAAFVTPAERAERLGGEEPPEPPPAVEYPLTGGRTLTVPGVCREQPAEVLFRPDADNLTLTTMVLNALLKCPVDTRRPLAASLVVMGGTAQTPGLKARLLSELRRQVALPPYSDAMRVDAIRLHRPPAKDNYLAWLGGAMFGGTDVILTRSLSREKFFETGILPDWCSLKARDGDSRNV